MRVCVRARPETISSVLTELVALNESLAHLCRTCSAQNEIHCFWNWIRTERRQCTEWSGNYFGWEVCSTHVARRISFSLMRAENWRRCVRIVALNQSMQMHSPFRHWNVFSVTRIIKKKTELSFLRMQMTVWQTVFRRIKRCSKASLSYYVRQGDISSNSSTFSQFLISLKIYFKSFIELKTLIFSRFLIILRCENAELRWTSFCFFLFDESHRETNRNATIDYVMRNVYVKLYFSNSNQFWILLFSMRKTVL